LAVVLCYILEEFFSIWSGVGEEDIMKHMARLGITLMLICAAAGFGLAAVYAKTSPVIERRAQEDLLAAVRAAIPEADEIIEETQDGETYWLGKKAGEIVGGAMRVSSAGFREPIELMVGFDAGGKVSSVAVVSLNDTPGIGTRVNDKTFLDKFVGVENPMSVDAIAGATVSSSGVKSGVKKAVDFMAGIMAHDGAVGPIDIALVPDGTYSGTGLGFKELEVSVKVEGGRIVEVKVLRHDESPGISDPALSGIPKAIVEKQSVKVDAVSGATFTSQGIMEAVEKALAGAPTK
jgi:RnfABCDGE-type electron transport complex G subunit